MSDYVPTDDDAPDYLPADDDIWVDLDDFNTIPMSSNGAGPEHYDDSWLPINLADLPDVPPVQPTLGGVGLVYPGKRHVFSGPPESVKTLAAYLIGLQVVREGQNLIVIDFEMGRYEARNRLRELGATSEDFGRIRYLEPNTPATPDTMGRLLFFEPALVIIDAAAGAYELQGLDDNKRSDVGRFISLYVKEFFRHEIATIVIDHVVKNTETRGQFTIGSERKVGGVEVHLGFEATIPLSRGGHGLYKIVTHKDRGGYLQRGKVADLDLVSDPETHQITWELRPAEKLEPTEIWLPWALMEKVSVYLSVLHEPVSRTHIEENVLGRATHLRRAIDHLVRLGYATESDGGRGARPISHNRLFHHNDLSSQTDLNDPVPSLVEPKTDTQGTLQLTPSHPVPTQSQDGPRETASLSQKTPVETTPSHPVPLRPEGGSLSVSRPTPSASPERGAGGTGSRRAPDDEKKKATPSRPVDIDPDLPL